MLIVQRMWLCLLLFFFSSRRRHTRLVSDWSSDVCSSDLQRVVRALSVHGRPMRIELLAGVHGDVMAVMKALTTLADKAIVQKQDGPWLAFNIAHDRMRETIYADLDEPQRKLLHRTIGEKLEATSSGLGEEQKQLDELARHFRGAGLEEKALDYALRAGRRAVASYANDTAVEHLLYVNELNERRGAQEIEVL